MSTDFDLVFERDVASSQFLLYLVEPRMGLDLLDGVALADVAHQDLTQEVLGASRHKFGDGVVAGQDLFVQHAFAVFIERQKPTEHRIQCNAAAPDVDRDGVVELPIDDLLRLAYFWCGIARRPARGFKLFVVHVEISKSKINEF